MTATPAAAPHALKRSLRYWDLIVYGLAYIAPIAPLSTLGFVWEASHGLIALAYVLGGVCMYFTAKSYAVMTEATPTAGSVYGFARHALGPLPGFLAGWMILLDYLLIPSFVYVLIAVAMETLVPGVDRALWIVLMVAITTGINWFGVTVTTRANFVAVGVQVAVLLGLLVLAVVGLYHGKGTGGLTLLPFWAPGRFEAGALFTATSISVMSFLGFDAISTLSEEVEGHDRRVVGRAIIAVLVISAAFFVLVSWVLGNVLAGITIKDPAAAAYEVTRYAIGAWAAVVLAWAYALVVGFSNALPMQVGVARVLFAMGRDRQLPSGLARVHARYHTPYVGMLATAAISLAVALAMRNMMDELATIVNFGALSGFLLLHVSVIVQFGLRGGSRQLFAHWLAPLAGIVVVGAVFSGMSRLATEVGLGWLAAGIVWGLVLHARHRDELHAEL
ncbi:MAG: APC family permease [Proteobacteria bacterium]|nr:APC family permease [Pseudomonadota bacterium]